ncbi:MAG: hypothetical protein AAB649_00830 [Patescibacteria group bacterium]
MHEKKIWLNISVPLWDKFLFKLKSMDDEDELIIDDGNITDEETSSEETEEDTY